MSASGSPRVSCSTITSVTPLLRHAAIRSGTMSPPRLSRCALGTSSRTSLANCASRDDGSRLVVTTTLGGVAPASAYSSSTWLRGASCAASA